MLHTYGTRGYRMRTSSTPYHDRHHLGKQSIIILQSTSVMSHPCQSLDDDHDVVIHCDQVFKVESEGTKKYSPPREVTKKLGTYPPAAHHLLEVSGKCIFRVAFVRNSQRNNPVLGRFSQILVIQSSLDMTISPMQTDVEIPMFEENMVNIS